MLSQTAEYALRAIVHLGERNGDSRTVQQIADAIQAPAGYLAKVLQELSKAGIVNSRRGLHGGFVLAAPPQDITVYDVLQAVDPIKRFHSCPLKRPDHKNLCPLHRELDDALAVIETAFRKASIAGLIRDGSTSSLCTDHRHACQGDASVAEDCKSTASPEEVSRRQQRRSQI